MTKHPLVSPREGLDKAVCVTEPSAPTPHGPGQADLCRVNTASQCCSLRPFTHCISSMTRQRQRTRARAV